MPDSWREGGFLGNGLLGVIYKTIEDKNVLCFEINRGDLYDTQSISGLPVGMFF